VMSAAKAAGCGVLRCVRPCRESRW
jgi:hypothetical protein